MRAMGTIFVVENWFFFRMCVIIYSFINNIIIHHDFLPPPRRGSHFKSDNTHTMINTHPLAHIRDTRDLIFSSCAPFTVYPNPIMPRHYAPLQVIITRAREGGPKEKSAKQKMARWNSFSYICTRALHSFRSFALCRATSTVIPLLPKATFIPSIQPNLGLPGTRPSLTSAINTLLAMRYSSILSTCPNHLNTLWSALLAITPFLSSSPAHLFIPKCIHLWHS